ncbi:MAG: helix-turn-helix domain containing protein [Bacteroidales bacterium]|nr:TetR/AcrR family transcriptional regulator [Bacteroidales bacterium]MDD2425088.1 helix-turn-helix domain containing protein [Bacteroidales bacterium]MDD3988591.1 helix-turn-helix domain containing protein [Bacteroidales bacterium]MDD4639359.1 helix-turn-helix domain containing protein [Bacteroidales bacterium]
MIKPNKKYSDILAAARVLFWKHGFKRVSVDEICKEAKASKMTFYKYFGNKTELAKTIFDNLVESGEKEFSQIVSSKISPAEKIKRIMMLKLEGTENISREFINDFYLGNEIELKNFVEERTLKAWENIKKDYKSAQESGFIRKDLNIDFIIKVQFKMVELLKDESTVKMFESQQKMIMELATILVSGIVDESYVK